MTVARVIEGWGKETCSSVYVSNKGIGAGIMCGPDCNVVNREPLDVEPVAWSNTWRCVATALPTACCVVFGGGTQAAKAG